VRRDGLSRDIILPMVPSIDLKYQIQTLPNPTAAQQKVLNKWLGK